MKFAEVDLPSNKKFGFFFTFLFVLATSYFYLSSSMLSVYSMALISLILFFVTIVKAEVLSPLNKLWMRFGLLIGMIVSPIVLGFIFYGLFTPIAFFMRLNGRDELRLKFNNKVTHWILRKESIEPESFKKQF
jgi:hypothetical protein